MSSDKWASDMRNNKDNWMLNVSATGHIGVRGQGISCRKNTGGGGACKMTKAQEKSGPHIFGYTS